MERFCKSVEIWQNYDREFVASLFWPSLYIKDRDNMRKFHYNCTTLAKFSVSGHNSITLNHTLLKLSNSTESHQIKKLVAEASLHY